MKTKKKATKKQKMWALVGLVCVAVVLILFITIGIPMIRDIKNSGYNSKYIYDGMSLVGVWQEKENFDDACYKIYEFKENGKAITTLYVRGIVAVRDELSTYRIEDKNTLIVTYTIDGNPKNSESKFSISEDKNTLVLRADGKNTILCKYNLEYNEDESIFGEWVSDKNITYNFQNDYTGKNLDATGVNNIVYSTKGDKLYMFYDEYFPIEDYSLQDKYVLEYSYKIEGSTLTLTDINGNTASYQRK